ncbi:hypothetical protein [Pseudoclavibacter sp. RFBA6]|uniref:hypothetical protein n=1 Tax=Pseudoclavibacter sp. RFBA6 TaxID=2080573 RepID=UPI000CE71E92|nr:hypothetical protein [Pseudoclavibacter sp. RFBA6]PPG39467.1 hypothetical protein C5C17_11795 [Pseudoclavibacter sp. RFBA6]
MTAITTTDPRAATKAALERFLTGRSATVSLRDVPGDDRTRRLPYVQVRLNGNGRDSRLNFEATIRVLVYARDDFDSQQLASELEARLLDTSDALIRSVSPGLSAMPSTDPDLHIPFSFFTVTVRTRPVALGG